MSNFSACRRLGRESFPCIDKSFVKDARSAPSQKILVFPELASAP